MAVDPYADPQFLAFQRALGADDAQLQAMNDYRKSQLDVSLQSRLPDFTHAADARSPLQRPDHLIRYDV